MSFVLFFVLTWLVISIFTVLRKKLNLIENTLLFLFILLISINFSWIIIDELKLISITQKGLPYTAYLFNRSIIIPTLILLILNLIHRSENTKKKLIVVFSGTFIYLCISFLSNRIEVTQLQRWSLLYEGLYFLFLTGISFLALRGFKKVIMDVGTDQ